MTFVQFSVVLSVAKDLIAACHGHEILRCAQDDIRAVAKRRPKVGNANCATPAMGRTPAPRIGGSLAQTAETPAMGRPPGTARVVRVRRKGRKGRKPANRAGKAPDQTYSTFTISSSSTPAGVRSFTTSPCSARSSALAMGEIQLT